MNRKTRRCHDPIDLDFLEQRPRIRAVRKNVLVAFGDISGFRDWTKLPMVSSEKFARFMVRVYEEFINFRNGSGYFVKLMGDGFMAVRELTESPIENNSQVFEMLRHASELVLSVGRLIKNLSYPQPGGFRIRIVVGDVLRLEALHAKEVGRAQMDYIGYPINLASTLLDIERDTPCICHETVREIAVRRPRPSAKIKFDRLPKPAYCPRGIEQEDLAALWTFQILKKTASA